VVVVPGESYDDRAAAFMAELRRKADDQLPADQARELVADIDEHLASLARAESPNPDEIFQRLGTPDDLVREALGVNEPTRRRVSRTARIRNAQTVAPELLALTLLYLACFGGERQVGFPDLQYDLLGLMWSGLLALVSPVLLIAGGWLLCLSRRLTSVAKTVGIGTALVFPLALSQVTPHLSGWNETCSSGDSVDGSGKLTSSYSYCLNGPNWVTHTVEWVWTLVPLVIMLVLGAVTVRRQNRIRRGFQTTPLWLLATDYS